MIFGKTIIERTIDQEAKDFRAIRGEWVFKFLVTLNDGRHAFCQRVFRVAHSMMNEHGQLVRVKYPDFRLYDHFEHQNMEAIIDLIQTHGIYCDKFSREHIRQELMKFGIAQPQK